MDNFIGNKSQTWKKSHNDHDSSLKKTVKCPEGKPPGKNTAILPRIVAWSVAYHDLSTDPYPRLNAVE